MNVELLNRLCAAGHVASTAQLRQRLSARQLAEACHSGMIRRIARGLYACVHLDPQLAVAAGAGGRLDCVSSLARHSVWSGVQRPGLHLRMEPHQHERRSIPGAVVHWGSIVAIGDRLEVSHVDAVLQAIRCLGPDDALACVESALHTNFLTEDQLDLLMLNAPARFRPTFARIDRGAQSGYETLVRLNLIRAGLKVRTQAYIPGAGDVDILVEECVGLEIDGEQWHGPERFIPDRTKDRNAELQGVRMLRVARPHIFEDWPRTLAAIQTMVNGAQPPGRRRS